MAEFSAMRGMLGVESQRGPLSPLGGASGPGSITRPEAPSGGAKSVKEVGFADALEKAAGELEAAHGVADQRSLDLIMGREVAVHDVMAAVAEAEIATQVTTAVAVKAISAYQEIWRMEI